MKVSINSKFLTGPYGGGIQFANYMREFLAGKGISVVNHLEDKDIDVILHVNPFPFLTRTACAYSFLEAYAYKIAHPQTVVILRVNECDERKGTHYMNRLLVKAARYSDMVVCIASWLKPLLEKKGLPSSKPTQVILNGADQRIFNTEGKQLCNNGKMKIVTHHWSGNPNKGHDIYKKLDALLATSEFAAQFEFTYVGVYPKELPYANTRLVAPLEGKALAEELKKHHIYITASRNEPGGMHHIEGALCGLPILYVNSGALPEYCAGYGLEFSDENLEQKLLQMREEYSVYIEKLKTYTHTAQHMAQEYLAMIEQAYANRAQTAFKSSSSLLSMLVRWYASINTAWWNIKRILKIL